jgi:peptide/nickel transport system substrate-binding protein
MFVIPTRRSSLLPTRRELGSFACLLLAVAVAGCHDATASGSAKEDLTIGISIPKVGGEENSTDKVSGSMKVETALATAQDGKPAKRIFDDWAWIEHGHALQLHLQPNIFFHDGSPLTAELAADILRERLTHPELTQVSQVESVVATDASHVVIRTKRQEGLLLADLSMIEFELPGHPGVGTGPFKATSDPSTIEAFDKYYLGAPTLKRIKVVEYESQRATWTALMRGEIDMLHEVSREAAEFVDAESSLTATKFLRPYYNGIVFNTKHPVLSKREVRVALNEAIDRTAIVRLSMRGQGRPASGPVWPLHWAYATAVPELTYEPDRAAQRLDALGYTVGSSREPGRMPSRFHFKCLMVENDATAERIALRVQRQLYELGIDMEVASVKPKEFGKAFMSGNFDAVLVEIIGSRALNWLYVLWHSPQPGVPSQLPSGYRAADEALDRFRAATGDAEIRASVEDMQRVFRDDPPAIFLAWQERSRALSKAFMAPDDVSGDILGTVRQWRGVPLSGQAAK